jgi:hypothetical protein
MGLRDVWVLVGSRRVRADLVEIIEARLGGMAVRVAAERQPLIVAMGGAAGAAMGEPEAMAHADMLLAAMSVGAQLPHGALVVHEDDGENSEPSWQVLVLPSLSRLGEEDNEDGEDDRYAYPIFTTAGAILGPGQREVPMQEYLARMENR